METVVAPTFARNQTSDGFCRGVVSWGSPQCSALKRHTVFARVAKFRKWIDDFVN